MQTSQIHDDERQVADAVRCSDAAASPDSASALPAWSHAAYLTTPEEPIQFRLAKRDSSHRVIAWHLAGIPDGEILTHQFASTHCGHLASHSGATPAIIFCMFATAP